MCSIWILSNQIKSNQNRTTKKNIQVLQGLKTVSKNDFTAVAWVHLEPQAICFISFPLFLPKIPSVVY